MKYDGAFYSTLGRVVNGHTVRYSRRLNQWIVDEIHYFDTKKQAFASIGAKA